MSPRIRNETPDRQITREAIRVTLLIELLRPVLIIAPRKIPMRIRPGCLRLLLVSSVCLEPLREPDLLEDAARQQFAPVGRPRIAHEVVGEPDLLGGLLGIGVVEARVAGESAHEGHGFVGVYDLIGACRWLLSRVALRARAGLRGAR